MQRYSIFRLAPIITKTEIVFTRSLSKNANEQRVERMFNDQQAPYYTAKDVEFCPNRSKEIMQNNVKETSEKAVGNTDYVAEKKMCSTSTAMYPSLLMQETALQLILICLAVQAQGITNIYRGKCRQLIIPDNKEIMLLLLMLESRKHSN
ncbi:uncharacterized protein CEXT_331311 [Caerostris extrusa]|uniref:Uncharacterized protein n=1 Tax=Caerostris extrusa TaxID=172846 RepID=A0AAV4NMK9_CAEEX|nr:uncharacterized protein CEXT_331311 [Caerostris extrusa]